MARQERTLARWFWPALVGVIGLALALYGRALTFGFFNDDPTGHFAWMETMRLWEFFVDVGGRGYYRPISFILMELFHTSTGAYSRVALHTLLLFFHVGNVLLLALLARALSGKPLYGLAAALIFVVVPFNYEAIAYVGAFVHPLVTFWTLLTLWTYLQAHRADASLRLFQLFVAHLALILGLFSHENGMAIVLLLLVLEWLWLDGNWRRVAPFLIAPAVFIVIWLLIPKSGETAVPALAALWQNGAVFWQTAVFPLLPFISLNANQIWAVAGLFLASAALLGWLAWRRGAARLWLFALAWIGATSAPAILFLVPSYVLGGPRLTYLPSLGAALLWAILFQRRGAETAEGKNFGVEASAGTTETVPAEASTPKQTENLPHLRFPFFLNLGLATAVLLAVILPPLPFITCQLDFYATTTQIVDGMVAAANAAAGTTSERPLRFANVPTFFSSSPDHPDGCTNPYPWTPVGAVVMPAYANAADFVRFNGGPTHPAQTVSVPDYTPGWQTHGPERPLGTIYAELNETSTFVFDLPTLAFFDLSAAWKANAQPPPELANFAGLLALADTAVIRDPTTITVDLTWHVDAPPDQPVTAFVHLYDAGGVLVTQHDAPPAQGFAPFSHWRPADAIHDRHIIQLNAPLPNGRYTLAAGLYYAYTGDRLPADATGAPLPDNVYPLATFDVEE